MFLYSGKDTDNLLSLRYVKYMKMASTTSSVKPEKLPPTERAAHVHSLCVYYQVQLFYNLLSLYGKTVQVQSVGAGNFSMEH